MDRDESEVAAAEGTATSAGQSAADAGRSDPQARSVMAVGAALLGLGRGVIAVAGAATTIVMAHLLGSTAFGAYAVAQTLIMLLLVLTTLGAEHGIVYYVSSGRWSPGAAFRDSQALALMLGLGGALIAVAARLVLPSPFHGLSITATLTAAAALPFALSWFYGSYVELARERYERYVVPAAMQALLAVSLSAILAALGGLSWAIVGLAGSHAITAAVRLWLERKEIRSATPRSRRRTHDLRRALGFGVRGYAANALQAVNYRLDLLILNATASGAAVGHYAVAVAITSVLWLLPQALADVVFPRVAALSNEPARGDQDALRQAEITSLRHTCLLTVVGIIVIVFVLLALVEPVFGARFRSSTSLGLILLPGCAMLAIANPLASMIVGRGHPNYLLAVTLVITPLTIALYAAIIPALHATGAALASSISYAGAFLLVVVAYRHLTGTNALVAMVPRRADLMDYRLLARSICNAIARRPRAQ